MITKAYIQEVLSPHSVKVRIPILNKIEDVNGATPNSELPTAAICTLPNMITDAHAGDIVIVGFEENSTSKPIVLGHLSTHRESNSLTDIKTNNLEVKGDTILGGHTQIGDVTPENIECLKYQKDNINIKFQTIDTSIAKINSDIKSVYDTAAQNSSYINDIKGDLSAINLSINTLRNRLDIVEEAIIELANRFDNYVEKYPAIFTGSYGDSVSNVASPEEGQIYFTLKGDG